jgi:PncC family amidohydrolase
MAQHLMPLVQSVADLLKQTSTHIVFAESCTAGLVSAALARVPGISEFHCGSAVVYQVDTKKRWLGIGAGILHDPGPVSSEVAAAMAKGVLEKTPAADLALSITGHLGPNAPAEQDGLVFVGVATRMGEVKTFRHVLRAEITGPSISGVETLREWRQWKAAELVLEYARDELS